MEVVREAVAAADGPAHGQQSCCTHSHQPLGPHLSKVNTQLWQGPCKQCRNVNDPT